MAGDRPSRTYDGWMYAGLLLGLVGIATAIPAISRGTSLTELPVNIALVVLGVALIVGTVVRRSRAARGGSDRVDAGTR